MTKEEKGEEERGMARGRRREEMVKGVGKKRVVEKEELEERKELRTEGDESKRASRRYRGRDR